MVSVPQAKKIVEQTVILNAVDRYAYNVPFDNSQMLMDALNFTVSEYFTRDAALTYTSNLFQGMDNDMRVKLVTIMLNFTQDQLMQRFGKNRYRSYVEALVGFTVAEYGQEFLRNRFPGTL